MIAFYFYLIYYFFFDEKRIYLISIYFNSYKSIETIITPIGFGKKYPETRYGTS